MPIKFPEPPKRADDAEKAASKDASAEPGPRRIALLIGNGTFRMHGGQMYNIDGVDKDLDAVGKVLGDAESAGFEVRSLFQPTLLEARRAVARAARDVRQSDILVVYYSGTSTVREGQLYLPVVDSDDEFLEATSLDSDYVLSCLRASKCRQQVLLMDGCHSGAFFARNRGIPDGFCAIMSCGATETCYGNADGGFFTRLLVEGLQGARADSDGDGTVTTEDVFRYIVPRSKGLDNPIPQLWSWNLPEPIPLVRVRQKLFLSYKRADSAIADAIAQRLTDAGYGIWMDRPKIRGGSQWRDEIDRGLTQSDAVVVLLSASALESDEIYKEIARALELDRPIIPITLGAITLHGWYKDKLGGVQQIAYPADSSSGAWFEQLVSGLRHCRRPPAPVNS